MAIRRLAHFGLNLDGNDEQFVNNPQHIAEVSSIIIDQAIGHDLAPSLALDQATLRAVVKNLGNPVVSEEGERTRDLDSFLWGYHIKIADAAFLFGLISGTLVTWPVIQAIDPPNRPPIRKGGGARKGLNRLGPTR
ncbi:MAG: hypothetical protein ABJA98_22140 [Acidobacteriota bacterium]